MCCHTEIDLFGIQRLLYSWCSFSWSKSRKDLISSDLSEQSILKKSPHNHKKGSLLVKDSLIRVLLRRLVVNLLGQPIWLVLMRNLQARLGVKELSFLLVQSQRLFRLMPANLNSKNSIKRYTFRFGAIALYLAVAYKDTTLFVNWMQSRLRFMNLFRHRQFFRIIGVALLPTLLKSSNRYSLAGFSMQVTGKLSVTGNAMSRTYLVKKGVGSLSSLNCRLAQSFSLVRTRTGCLGLWINFFF